jgi:hypothetical protein
MNGWFDGLCLTPSTSRIDVFGRRRSASLPDELSSPALLDLGGLEPPPATALPSTSQNSSFKPN